MHLNFILQDLILECTLNCLAFIVTKVIGNGKASVSTAVLHSVERCSID